MGKRFDFFYKQSKWLLGVWFLLFTSLATALDKTFPDLNKDLSFRNSVETALTQMQYSFLFTDSSGDSRRFVIDYDPSFYYSFQSRPDSVDFKAFLSRGTYRAIEVKDSPYDRVEYRLTQEVRIPKVEEWERTNGVKWDGSIDDWEGEWDKHIIPSFGFYLTAYDSEDDEPEIQYLDGKGQIKMRYFVRVTHLIKKFIEAKRAESEASLTDLNDYIWDAQNFKDELVQEYFNGSERKFQNYLTALLAKHSSQLWLKLGKLLFTTEIINHVREQTHLPQHAIVQIMTERNL